MGGVSHQFWPPGHPRQATPSGKQQSAARITICLNPAFIPLHQASLALPRRTFIILTYAISSTYEWLGSHGNDPVKGARNCPRCVLRSEPRLRESLSVLGRPHALLGAVRHSCFAHAYSGDLSAREAQATVRPSHETQSRCGKPNSRAAAASCGTKPSSTVTTKRCGVRETRQSGNPNGKRQARTAGASRFPSPNSASRRCAFFPCGDIAAGSIPPA
jgi:hypothetical protein